MTITATRIADGGVEVRAGLADLSGSVEGIQQATRLAQNFWRRMQYFPAVAFPGKSAASKENTKH